MDTLHISPKKLPMFDYCSNKTITEAIDNKLKYIKCELDKEDCRQEIFTQLYTDCPFTEIEAIEIVCKCSARFLRQVNKNRAVFSLDQLMEVNAI